MSEWTPILLDELQSKIDASISEMSPAEMGLWTAIRLKPTKWELPPIGNEGDGFWVVAVFGESCIYYNDVEEGFNISSFTVRCAGGRLIHSIDDYFCNEDRLVWIIRRMATGRQ
jgi:hypothetical protein